MSIEQNNLKNPKWPEDNQLAIYKRSQEIILFYFYFNIKKQIDINTAN